MKKYIITNLQKGPVVITKEQLLEIPQKGGAQFLVEILYSDLKTLRDTSKLSPGTQYRITDYVTTVRADLDYAISAGNQFDIIVTADSDNKLNEVARAIRHEGDIYFPEQVKFESWELKYSLDNDVLRYDWADSVNGKGVIYFMKDEFDNEVPYDFKNIKFKRFKVVSCINYSFEQAFSGRYFGQMDTSVFTIDPLDFKFVFTFHDEEDDSEVSTMYKIGHGEFFGSNIIGGNFYATAVDDLKYLTLHLNNCVFLGNHIKKNVFGLEFENNTFGNVINYNTFGNNIYSNIFGNNIETNTFRNNIYSNTFGNNINSNTFGNNIYSNTFGDSLVSNTFGNDINYNTFGNDIGYNTFGDSINYNTFGNNIYSNTFGNYIGYNTFGGNKGGDRYEYYGTYLIVKDGVRGIDETQKLNINAGITLLPTTPRQVTISQSATEFSYVFESKVSATVTESIDHTVI